MMQTAEKLISFVQKHWKGILALFASLAVLLILSNYTIVDISAVDPAITNDNTSITMRDSRELPWSPKVKKRKFGVQIVKKGEVIVEASHSESRTSIKKYLSAFRINKMSIELKKPRTIDLLLADIGNGNCVFSNASGKYGCSEAKLYRQKVSDTISKVGLMKDRSLVGTPKPYQKGIISLVSKDESGVTNLSYIDGGTVSTIVENSSQYNGMFSPQSTVVTEGNGGKHFLVFNEETKTIWFFDGLSKPKITYNYSEDIGDKAKSVGFSIHQDSVYLNYFVDNKGTDPEEAHPEYSSYAIRYKAGSSKLKKLTEYVVTDTTKEKRTDGYTEVVSEDTLLSKSFNDTLFVLNVGDKGLSVEDKLYNIDEHVVLNETVYYRQGNKIYSYDPQKASSNLVVDAKEINIFSLSAQNGSIVFSGTPKNTPSTTNAYIVLDKDYSETLPFHLIPYNLNDLPLVRSEFTGSKLFFTVKLNSLIFNRQTSKPTYDRAEYKMRKDMILRRLKYDGLNLTKYQVYFKPGA